MSIRLPRLMDASLTERARLTPMHLALDLHLLPLSTADMTLAPDDADISIHDLVEFYDGAGSVGVFRVDRVNTLADRREIHLHHGLGTLADDMVDTMSYFGPVRACLEQLLACQSRTRWALGDCDIPLDLNILFTSTHEDVLTAVIRLVSMLPEGYMLHCNQTGSIWTLHIRQMADTDACEGRLSRNLSGVSIDLDGQALCTRVYPYGAMQGLEPISLTPLTGQPYLQAEEAATWGVISHTFTEPQIMDAMTLQDVAARYLARHAKPRAAITMEAIDLSQATGEPADSFRLGRMCRLALPDLGVTVHERVTGVRHADVYGQPGRITVTLSDRTRAVSDEIAALLQDSLADKLLGGRVSQVESDNRAEGATTSPIVHYFTVEDWPALLEVTASFVPDEGVSVRDVRIDDTYLPIDVWQHRAFSAFPYLQRDALGLPTVGSHRLILYPSSGTSGDLAAVESTVTLTIIDNE